MRPWAGLAALALDLVFGTSSCDFSSAFARYCAGNSKCAADAGGKDAGTKDSAPAGDDSRPDQASDSGPDQAPDTGPPMPPVSCGMGNKCPFPNQICHPYSQVCLSLCNSPADCPIYLDNCTEIRDRNGSPVTPKVCQCTSAEICDSYYADPSTCNPRDGLCEMLCYSSWDCTMFQPPRTCDVMGVCVAGIPPCSGNQDCFLPTLPRCDPVTRRCTGCTSDSDCSFRPDGLLRCSSAGSCVAP